MPSTFYFHFPPHARTLACVPRIFPFSRSYVAFAAGAATSVGGVVFPRYDSADRHCRNCETFKGFAGERLVDGTVLSPLLLTRGEFEAIRDFRKHALPGHWQRCYSPQVQNAVIFSSLNTVPVFKLLKMMVTSQVSIEGKGKAEA